MQKADVISTSAAPQLAVWEFAGLMVTYWCNAKCAFCYVYSAPDRGGEISVASAVAMWKSLDQLAAAHGKKMRIHLAGGEPFGDWPRLVSIIRAARYAGLTPLEKVETNAFWATDDDQTRAKLELLNALGMEKLLISADVYHQEFVPFDRVQRCVTIARKVLGAGRVRVRWWEFLHRPTDLRRADDATKRQAFQQALERHKDRLTGRAADRLADFFPRYPAAHFKDQNCVKEVLQSHHVHIDPYGNVFPGVCAGIIFGQVAAPGFSDPLVRESFLAPPSAGKDSGKSGCEKGFSHQQAQARTFQTVEELWHALAQDWPKHPVVGPVVRGGSFALLQEAQKHGYRELPAGYANKCHLCTHVRQFLLERGGWEESVGPPECYANEKDRREAEQWRAVVPLTTNGGKRP